MSSLKSVEEAHKVVDSLTSLCHLGKDFSKFPPHYIDLIMSEGRSFQCGKHLHPGLGCMAYAAAKFKKQCRSGLQISAIFIVLPAVIQSFRKLFKDSATRWHILEKFIRSTLYLTVFGALPPVVMCISGRFGLKPNKYSTPFFMGVGALVAFMFEPPTRHVQLLSYMLPKVIETLSNIL